MFKKYYVVLISCLFVVPCNYAGYIDRSAAQVVWRSAKYLVTNYPLMTGLALTIVFRHQLMNLFLDHGNKKPVAFVGEHPIIVFSLGLFVLATIVDLSE
jgi:hypothetical protein